MENNMDTVKYTVLMSVYNKEQPTYLDISIKSMLAQSIKPDEFIIVKDGPLTPELDAVIEGFVLNYPKLFHIIPLPKNQGLGPALACGVIAAKNELIARMDSDDYSVQTRCEKELAEFIKDPNLEMVGTFEAEFVGDIDNVISIHKVPGTNEEINRFMRRRCAVLHPTVMYKKSSVIRSGNYHSVLLYEDYDLFARMVLENKVKCLNIQEPLYHIRTSGDFFMRRGGYKYAKTVLHFKWGLFRKGYMSIMDFCISGLGQAFVCILPNSLRKAFYLKLLRK